MLLVALLCLALVCYSLLYYATLRLEVSTDVSSLLHLALELSALALELSALVSMCHVTLSSACHSIFPRCLQMSPDVI